jgi:SAM-dependent methyltransferase
MFTREYLLNGDITDSECDDLLFSVSAKSRSSVHWTPLKIIMQASQWLAPKAGTKVLDVGSGVGKFCIVGACFTEGYFTGVEHRAQLVHQAKKAAKKAKVSNVQFLLDDMISVDFGQFDSFYLFNPFYENLVSSLAIDDEIELSEQKYQGYLRHVNTKLDRLKSGTRVATYFGSDLNIPSSYELVFSSSEEDGLRFWMKR